ncbi:MAG: hypothetical protein ACOYXC_07105 [Candidatus Rifleibacteriota bacterium]
MRKFLYCFLAIFLLQFVPVAMAQVSFTDGSQTDVVVEVDGVEEAFTIVRDFRKKEQFYYIPNRPQFATRGKGTQKKPVFHLLKYQALDEESNELVEGGIMQFAVKFAPDGEVVTRIRDKVAAQFSMPADTLKLSALPFKSAEVTVYDLEGNLLSSTFQTPGIAPSFANNEIPFQVMLTKLSSDVYDALTTGGGGIPVYITYTFDQVTSPVGFKVTVDWDQTFSHFSKDEKTKQAYTEWYYYRTWWGGLRARGRTGVQETHNETLSENLQESKSVKVEAVAGEEFTQEEINKYLDPILETISKELVEKVTPPEKIDPAAAKEPDNPGYWRTSTNVSVKSVNTVKKGTQVYDFSRRSVFESKSTYGSILGIGGYSDAIKKELVTIKPAGNWDYAYFLVPAVGDKLADAIDQITLQVTPRKVKRNSKGEIEIDSKTKEEKFEQISGTVAQLVTWTKDNTYFADKNGNEVNKILFPLQAITDKLAQDKIPLSDCRYEVVINVTQGSNKMKFESLEEFLIGGIPVSTPMARIEAVEVDCDIGLTFGEKGSSDKNTLAAVIIKIVSEKPSKTYNQTIKSDSDEKIAIFLVEKEDEGIKNPVKATINFQLFNSKKIPWKNNGRNLRDDDLGLSIMLWDEDWQAQN